MHFAGNWFSANSAFSVVTNARALNIRDQQFRAIGRTASATSDAFEFVLIDLRLSLVEPGELELEPGPTYRHRSKMSQELAYGGSHAASSEQLEHATLTSDAHRRTQVQIWNACDWFEQHDWESR
jgi:hypothetical protein